MKLQSVCKVCAIVCAYKFYKNPNYWWILASANDIKGTMYTELGIQLRIPRDISYILAEFNRINGV